MTVDTQTIQDTDPATARPMRAYHADTGMASHSIATGPAYVVGYSSGVNESKIHGLVI